MAAPERPGLKFVSAAMTLWRSFLNDVLADHRGRIHSRYVAPACNTSKINAQTTHIPGLTSAIALKASGHTVLVLEKEPRLGGAKTVCPLNASPMLTVSEGHEKIPNGGAR